MQRILFMHNINKGKAGKAQSLRIPQTVWDLEVDLACLAGHVLDAMSSYRNPENLLVFDEAVIKAAMTNFIEGDFHEDLKVFNEVKDPRFTVEQTKMWTENVPTSSKPLGESQLQLADGKINQLVLNQTKLQFEADALSLARDASQLANLYNAEMQSERSTRLARVMHLKQENQIGSVIIWLDYTKYGTLSNTDLNNTVALAQKAMSQMPEQSCCFAIAPLLASDRRSGFREEFRRIEDKMEAKGLDAESVFLRFDTPPANKKVALSYQAWIINMKGPNVEQLFVVPRQAQWALSECQEKAQLMTGLTMPKAVIASLLNGGAQPGQHVGILNLSPYDGCLEKVALSWHLDHPERHLSSMALSTDMDVIAYNEKVVALYLIEEWKAGSHVMGDVRPYDPSAPAAAAVDLEKYPLKLAKVAMDPSKKGWERFRVTLSNEVRSMYVDDAIHSPKWKDLVLDFDRKFCGGTPVCEAIVPAEDEEEEMPQRTTFAEGSEPDLLSTLLDQYIVECRFAGRTPGTSLYLAHAVRRDGTRTEMVDNQKFKLFLVAHQDLEIDAKEFIIGHGKSTFMKPDKVAKMDLDAMLDASPGALQTPPASVPNRSPSFGDGPASAPKEAAKGVKLDDTRLPMVSHTADRKKLDKALSREQFEAAKRNVDSALKEVTTGRKSALKKDREESEVKHTRKGSKRETPKEVLDKLDTPKMNLSKEAGKIACKRLLDGLVRPAKAPEEKKAKVTKGKMKKAAAVEKTDDEDQKDCDSIDSEETLELPGKGDSNDGPGDDGAGDGSDVESVAANPGDDSTKGDDQSSLRTLYWAAVHEAQKRIKREFPDLSGREVLKRARAERLGCIYLLNSIFGIVQSENSKACSDAEPCAIGDLLREMEEEGITDVSFMATHVPVPRLTASKILDASPALDRRWRVAYAKAEKESLSIFSTMPSP
ncbi:unnamed protein product [Cladocopium goreaui]|uniref:Uncharacterized protein n=1 Tax=Cladocopium goreaui TaxID=2562237 RepID=A0A9P1M616_9DINO|nr:unnamed protein product [Cladocopium goreaui]